MDLSVFVHRISEILDLMSFVVWVFFDVLCLGFFWVLAEIEVILMFWFEILWAFYGLIWAS
jgi:hypothetical protein